LHTFELAGGLGNFGGGIFDVLGFVQDDEAEVVFFEFVDITLKEGEGGDDDIGVTDVGEEFLTTTALKYERGERRSKFFDFGKPVGDDTGGGDY